MNQVRTSDGIAPEPAEDSAGAVAPEEWGRRPIRLLLVDDDETIRRAYSRSLMREGYQVAVAADGASAERQILEHRFDVVVSDISMPGLDGLQLLRTVRQYDLDLPVLLMTGDPNVKTAAAAVEFGALRYLLKPVETDVLQKAVRHAARLHHIARLKRHALALSGNPGAHAIGDRAALEMSFQRALDALFVVYQPIVSWRHRRIYAFECLLRTRETSLPNPGAVLEAAERLGRLFDLGRQIRNRIAAETADRTDVVFVNVSPQDLLDDHLYAADAPLSRQAARVILEITERSTLDSVPDTSARIAHLRGLGFRLALDDVGAGYAGLSSFAQLEPDLVKIDMSLIRGLHQSRNKIRLVQSLYEAFNDLNIPVVAEGVESAEERDALVSIGADLMQGYHFAYPAPSLAVTWPAARDP